MGLVLRKNLSTPLTHVQLDGNFEYIQTSEWVPQAYEAGKPIFIKSQTDAVALLYICIRTHSAMLYPNNQFVEFDQQGNRYWLPLSSSSNYIRTVEFLPDNITLRFTRGDGLVYEIKLSEDYAVGITSHQLLKLNSSDLTPTETTYNLEYLNEIARTDNTVLVELGDADPNENYFLVLPISGGDTAGARIKVILKSFQTINPNKKFYIKSNSVNYTNRILAVNLKTYVENVGYFMPMDVMEIVDLVWDGNDWLVTNYIKQEYVSSLAVPPVIN